MGSGFLLPRCCRGPAFAHRHAAAGDEVVPCGEILAPDVVSAIVICCDASEEDVFARGVWDSTLGAGRRSEWSQAVVAFRKVSYGPYARNRGRSRGAFLSVRPDEAEESLAIAGGSSSASSSLSGQMFGDGPPDMGHTCMRLRLG